MKGLRIPARKDRAPAALLILSCTAVLTMIVTLATGFLREDPVQASEHGQPAADAEAAYIGGHRTAIISFDDGPDPTWTPRVLGILREAHVHALFFLIGERAERYPDLVRQIVADGNIVANHTYTHPDPLRISTAELAQEIDRTNEILTRITGTTPTLFRPPYGHVPIELEQLMRQRSMRTVLWSDSPSDYQKPAASELVRRVLRTARLGPGTIVLLHDGDAAGGGDNRRQTCLALMPMIAGLQQVGFVVSTVVPPRDP